MAQNECIFRLFRADLGLILARGLSTSGERTVVNCGAVAALGRGRLPLVGRSENPARKILKDDGSFDPSPFLSVTRAGASARFG
jgi:hypothetical protein